MKERNDADDARNKVVLGRRSYLALVGASVGGLAGCTGQGASPKPATMEPLELFGYGGAAIIARDAVTVSAVDTRSEAEPNDSRANATRISVGAETTAELTAGDVDWFAFDADAGDELSLTLARESGDGVVAAVLYDTAGSFLNMVYSGSESSVVTETADDSGTYYAEIVDINDGTGSYVITVTNGEVPTSTPTPTPTATPTPTPTPTPVEDDYGRQGYGERGYGGV